MKAWLLGAAVVLLAGCATTVPEGVRREPAENPTLGEVRRAPESYVGRDVRWGGTIARVQNRSEQTCIEVVARELQSGGRPLEDDRSQGRFLACVNQFLDPAIFAEERQITVRGIIEGAETLPVGDYPYRYPRVQVAAYQLWTPLPEARAYPRDPYWDPFWHGPWPYRRHPFYYPGW